MTSTHPKHNPSLGKLESVTRELRQQQNNFAQARNLEAQSLKTFNEELRVKGELYYRTDKEVFQFVFVSLSIEINNPLNFFV